MLSLISGPVGLYLVDVFVDIGVNRRKEERREAAKHMNEMQREVKERRKYLSVSLYIKGYGREIYKKRRNVLTCERACVICFFV